MALEISSPVNDAGAEKKAASALDFLQRVQKVGVADRMFFTEQLSLLLETGESLYGALATVAQQTENARMRTIVAEVAEAVSEGRSFAHALSQHAEVFPSTYVNLIGASENGGFLHEVLLQLLDMDKKREKLHETLMSAATYPMFLIAFSLAVVIFVLVVVFPKFGTMFASIYDQLPATTKVLMAASEALRHHWYFLAAGIAGFTFGIRYWLRSEAGRLRIDHFKLHAPGISGLFQQIYLVQSFQVLSLSLVNKVSVMESLEACRDVVENTYYRRLFASVEASVQSGAGLAKAFGESDFVPVLAKHLVMTGEQTGNLGKVMARLAEYYEAQLMKKLDTLSKLAEPVMLLVMGVIVGVLVSSLILPIFKLSRAVS